VSGPSRDPSVAERFSVLQDEEIRASSVYRPLGAFRTVKVGQVPGSLGAAVPVVRWARKAEHRAPVLGGLLFGTPFGVVYTAVLTWAGGRSGLVFAMAAAMALGTGLAFGWIIHRAFRHVIVPVPHADAGAVESAIRTVGWQEEASGRRRSGSGPASPRTTGTGDSAGGPRRFRKPWRVGRLCLHDPGAGRVGFLAGPMGEIGEVVLRWRPELSPESPSRPSPLHPGDPARSP